MYCLYYDFTRLIQNKKYYLYKSVKVITEYEIVIFNRRISYNSTISLFNKLVTHIHTLLTTNVYIDVGV